MTTVDLPALMSWDSKVLKWTNNLFKVIDSQTVEMTVSEFKKASVYYYIKFNVPGVGQGTLNGAEIRDGAGSVAGARIGGFLKFKTADVVAAVSVSDTSMERAKKYFEDEFGRMDFDAAVRNLKTPGSPGSARLRRKGPSCA